MKKNTQNVKIIRLVFGLATLAIVSSCQTSSISSSKSTEKVPSNSTHEQQLSKIHFERDKAFLAVWIKRNYTAARYKPSYQLIKIDPELLSQPKEQRVQIDCSGIATSCLAPTSIELKNKHGRNYSLIKLEPGIYAISKYSRELLNHTSPLSTSDKQEWMKCYYRNLIFFEVKAGMVNTADYEEMIADTSVSDQAVAGLLKANNQEHLAPLTQKVKFVGLGKIEDGICEKPPNQTTLTLNGRTIDAQKKIDAMSTYISSFMLSLFGPELVSKYTDEDYNRTKKFSYGVATACFNQGDASNNYKRAAHCLLLTSRNLTYNLYQTTNPPPPTKDHAASRELDRQAKANFIKVGILYGENYTFEEAIKLVAPDGRIPDKYVE